MKAGREELDDGRRIGVRVGELQLQLVRLATVRRVLGANDGAHPQENIGAVRESGDALLA